MKKIIVLLTLALLVGCAGVPRPEKETIRIPEVNVGTEGIVMDFMQNSPPAEVYEDTWIQGIINIKNKGTSDITNGYYSISTERQYAELIYDQAVGTFNIKGKSSFYPEGTEDRIEFRLKTKTLDPLTERYSTTLSFNACYPYQTSATLLTCVDTDIAGRVTQKTCTPRTETFSRGQGAPIAVTSIDPRMFPHEDPQKITPEFVITIDNLGKGEVVHPSQIIDACTGRPLGDINQVNVQASLSDNQLNCRPETLRLKKGINKVVCRLDQGIPLTYGTYNAPLTVKMSYGYIDNIVKNFAILKQR